jgi:hypothetical protein
MADVALPNLTEKGAEARLRSLMEDLVYAYIGIRPGYQLSLAVWFGKSHKGEVQHLLLLYSGPPMNELLPGTVPLLWKTGSQGPPLVEIIATSVDYFSSLITSEASEVTRFTEAQEILYLDKVLLNETILQTFRIVTEPPGLMKGWYVDAKRAEGKTTRDILSVRDNYDPDLGLVKVWESSDFENCRGLVHKEINQKWLPLSLAGLNHFAFFTDLQAGRPGFFLFRGGAFYQILKFEERTEPRYSSLVLQPSEQLGKMLVDRDDRYPEVYLRAVHPSEKPAA